MATKFDAYNLLFQTAWDRCAAGRSASIRLASISDLATFRTYLSRWKSLRRVEWPEKIALINMFRPTLRKADGGYFVDFYSLTTAVTVLFSFAPRKIALESRTLRKLSELRVLSRIFAGTFPGLTT